MRFLSYFSVVDFCVLLHLHSFFSKLQPISAVVMMNLPVLSPGPWLDGLKWQHMAAFLHMHSAVGQGVLLSSLINNVGWWPDFWLLSEFLEETSPRVLRLVQNAK